MTTMRRTVLSGGVLAACAAVCFPVGRLVRRTVTSGGVLAACIG